MLVRLAELVAPANAEALAAAGRHGRDIAQAAPADMAAQTLRLYEGAAASVAANPFAPLDAARVCEALVDPIRAPPADGGPQAPPAAAATPLHTRSRGDRPAAGRNAPRSPAAPVDAAKGAPRAEGAPALMASPEHDRWMALGRARQAAGRLFDAMICFRNAVRADATNADAPELLGDVLWQLGRVQDAAAAWREAVRRDGQARAPALALAGALLALGDATGAQDVAGRILTRHPGDARAELAHSVATLLVYCRGPTGCRPPRGSRAGARTRPCRRPGTRGRPGRRARPAARGAREIGVARSRVPRRSVAAFGGDGAGASAVAPLRGRGCRRARRARRPVRARARARVRVGRARSAAPHRECRVARCPATMHRRSRSAMRHSARGRSRRPSRSSGHAARPGAGSGSSSWSLSCPTRKFRRRWPR